MSSSHPAEGSNSDSAQQVSGSKRRRVAKACLSCRLHKSKCDGRRPICSRCRDYEHACTWSDSKIDHFKLGRGAQEHESPPSTLNGLQSGPTTENEYLLRQAIHSYDDLLDAIQYNLPETDRVIIASTVSSIRKRLPNITALGQPARSSITPILPEAVSPVSPGKLRSVRQRYLGEASELRFYHSVKRVLRDDQASDGAPGTHMDSYDQEDHFTEGYRYERLASSPPSRQLADKYVDIYFSTIHIAYPFLCRPVFMANYEKFWSGDIDFIRDDSWIPLLYTVFALGAYYTSFPRSKDEGVRNYSQYFKYASALAASVMTDCTLENIQILLSQCVFLLATSQTDRCWTMLGLAIRIAQTIGLHVEDSHKRSMTNPTLLESETMRRVWYTMYNMDRLLALQLGRPIAIHDDDYSVPLPSKAEDNCFNLEAEELSPPVNGGPSSVDFFLCVIRFSGVLGQVVRDLYRPSQLQSDPDSMLDNIANLDTILLSWKNNLPRHLRFDLGHVFENCIVFKRQRNMLAIKFHHLRALIHRSYLCLSRLQRNNAPLMDLLRRFPERVHYMERTCVFEAQQTAHLLNNVSNTGNLVHDFPWWQMIPCLLCASSILLVASVYTEPNQLNVGRDTDELREDAETCLKVFDALSVNSNAARRARDMLESLKPSRIQPRGLSMRNAASDATDNGIDASSASTTLLSRNATQCGSISSAQQPMNLSVYSLGNNSNLEDQTAWDMRSATGQSYESWPLELSDTMNWSAQFLDPGFLLKPLATPILALGDMDDNRIEVEMHGGGSGSG